MRGARGSLGQRFFERTRKALLPILNEAFAYRYLVRREYQGVSFVKEGNYRTPDIAYGSNGGNGLLNRLGLLDAM
jgi:hypothetical protein